MTVKRKVKSKARKTKGALFGFHIARDTPKDSKQKYYDNAAKIEKARRDREANEKKRRQAAERKEQQRQTEIAKLERKTQKNIAVSRERESLARRRKATKTARSQSIIAGIFSRPQPKRRTRRKKIGWN
jgi:aspartate oxidase